MKLGTYGSSRKHVRVHATASIRGSQGLAALVCLLWAWRRSLRRPPAHVWATRTELATRICSVCISADGIAISRGVQANMGTEMLKKVESGSNARTFDQCVPVPHCVAFAVPFVVPLRLLSLSPGKGLHTNGALVYVTRCRPTHQHPGSRNRRQSQKPKRMCRKAARGGRCLLS